MQRSETLRIVSLIALLLLGGSVMFLSHTTWAAVSPPTVRSSATSTSSSGVSHILNLPPTVSAEDVLLVFFSGKNSYVVPTTTISWPGGWTELYDGNDFSAAYKKAVGTEGGTQITVTTSDSQTQATHVSYAIQGAADPAVSPPEAALNATHTDPPKLTPSGGLQPYLWLTAAGMGSVSTFYNYPSGYSLNVDVTSQTSKLYTARRSTISVQSENPSMFSIWGSNPTRSATVAVPANRDTNVSVDVTEGGATDTYTVVLSSQPTANVVITVSDDSQVDVDKQSLTFTTVNWSTPQTVTVTAVDDTRVEGAHTGTITHLINSADPFYKGEFPASNVMVNITDNDVAGGSTDVTEGGATDTYTVVLSSQPTANVVITVSDDSQVDVDKQSLTFTTVNWSTPQTVTVTAVDDTAYESDPHTGTITHTAASSDPNYNGISMGSVTVDITENDFPPPESYIESTTINTEASNGFTINSMVWHGTQPSGTSVKFRIAVSNQSDSGFVFKGPMGSEVLGYEANEGVPVTIDSTYHDAYKAGYKYLRYRVYIDNGVQNPGAVVDDVIINYSS